jgi:hypothetical protein
MQSADQAYSEAVQHAASFAQAIQADAQAAQQVSATRGTRMPCCWAC